MKRSKYGSYASYKKICKEIYEEREMKCEVCGVYIYEPKHHNFHHEIDRRENFLNKDSIRLLCFVHHAEAEGRVEKNGEWLN